MVIPFVIILWATSPGKNGEWKCVRIISFYLLLPGVGEVQWEDTWQAWMRSVTGHHGMPPSWAKEDTSTFRPFIEVFILIRFCSTVYNAATTESSRLLPAWTMFSIIPGPLETVSAPEVGLATDMLYDKKHLGPVINMDLLQHGEKGNLLN